jgi:hypothetical protein
MRRRRPTAAEDVLPVALDRIAELEHDLRLAELEVGLERLRSMALEDRLVELLDGGR